MPRKCSVYGCRSGYDPDKKSKNDPTEKVKVYGFPINVEECRQWISALPNTNLQVEKITQYVGVCEKHWPCDAPMRLRGRHLCPSVPPSCFSSDIPKSALPAAPATPRTTSKALSAARTFDIDQMAEFSNLDRFATQTRAQFHTKFHQELSSKGTVAFNELMTEYVLLSNGRDGPIFNVTLIFSLLSSDDDHVNLVSFEAYHKLKAITVPYGDRGRLSSWSQLTEVLRFVFSYADEDKKMDFILKQVQLINSPKNSRIYDDQTDLCQAFSWYSRSRALYSELRTYIQLPSDTTLKRITRISKNMSDTVMYGNFFRAQEPRSRNCVLIVDEVYIKSSVSYSGGVLFGYSEDAPNKLANTLLCVMVKCLCSSKKFLAKLVPCNALTAGFQFDCVSGLISLLEGCGATVLAVITDNNRINQSFFKMFPGWSVQTPYLAKSPSSHSPLYLLFDPVHLLKNIRNNWVTEKTQTLLFPSNGTQNPDRKLAKWSDLRDLYKLDSVRDAKLSKLTKASICPSSMEKQKVSLALSVFCDSTVSALLTSESRTDSWKDTACFISMVTKLWKLLNCKTPVQHIHTCDRDRIPIDNGQNGQKGLQTLIEWANIASVMCSPGSTRVQSFTKDTSFALQWTCVGLAALSQFLLTTESSAKHDYICLGFFQQDDLEHHFGHFRRSAGCNYFISVREVFSTHGLDRAKLMLSLDVEIDNGLTSHQCDLCDAPVNDTELLMLDEMTNCDVNAKISLDEKMAIFYIAGYIAFKHKQLAGNAPSVSAEVKAYFHAINKKNLTQPSESFLHFMVLAYYYFTHSQELFCRKRLVKTLSMFSGLFCLDVEVPNRALQRISNILLNNFRKKFNQCSQGPDRKTAKLTSQSTSSTRPTSC